VDEVRFPPVFQAIGTEDEVFDISQVLSFDKKLEKRGTSSKVCVVEGKGHSFDMKTEVGDEIYISVILPAVDFAGCCVASSGVDDEFRK
jgi:acetyl esterase/lipase